MIITQFVIKIKSSCESQILVPDIYSITKTTAYMLQNGHPSRSGYETSFDFREMFDHPISKSTTSLSLLVIIKCVPGFQKHTGHSGFDRIRFENAVLDP